ncbi:MAG TPA: hypothetical protein VF397_00800 [Pyrinomonadaceae bacterium]
MKVLSALLLVPFALGGMLLSHGSYKSNTPIASTVGSIPAASQKSRVIDGATNPELIPDRVAYSIFFRLIANSRTPEKKLHIRSYIRQIGLSEADRNGLLAAADEFYQRVNPLDEEAKQIKAGNSGSVNDAVRARLQQLKQQKDAVIDHLVVRLPIRVSQEGTSLLRQHISEHIKRGIKLQSN